MSGNSVVYANARIKCLENNLLTRDKLVRMMDCATLEDAVKVLAETNYGGGLGIDNPKLFDKLLLAEEKSVTDFVRSLTEDGTGVACLLLRNDFHNAKVCYKSAKSGGDSSEQLKPDGLLNSGDIKNALASEDYTSLPEEMGAAFKTLNRLFTAGNGTPRAIDIELDKASYAYAFRVLGRSSGCIKEYFVQSADFSNISALSRCQKNGLGVKYFEELFIEGGNLSKDKLLSLYDYPDAMADTMRYSDYAEAFAVLSEANGGAKFEKYADDALLAIFKKEKYDMFSAAPVAGYYLGKLTEIKAARLILVCINNNVNKSVIRQRLRELYA